MTGLGTRQPWIGSGWFDSVFIIGPALMVACAVLALPGVFGAGQVPGWAWAVLVVGVDVGHVYSTLFRTYFDREEFARRRTLYVLAPLLGWMGFACLYSLGSMVFWRGLAYLAVFHFVRQQYGFMMIYGRWERGWRWLDQAAIYAATLYPLVWWHTHVRHFSWFVEGDFLVAPWPWVGEAALVAYAGVMAAYVVKEMGAARQWGFNWPRNLLLGGTALSWGVGIMAVDSDLAFTAANVVAHGVPYVALVWLHGRRTRGAAVRLFSVAWLPVFLLVPLGLAYLEEGVWDGLVWAEHTSLFAPFAGWGVVEDEGVLAVLLPLLALPQITHYVLDAFIWRRGDGGVGGMLR